MSRPETWTFNKQLLWAFNRVVEPIPSRALNRSTEGIDLGRSMLREHEMAADGPVKKKMLRLGHLLGAAAAKAFKFSARDRGMIGSILATHPFAPGQWPHRDLFTPKAGDEWQAHQFLILCACSDNDNFTVINGSHDVKKRSREVYDLQLCKYDVVFAHPLLVHGGAKGVADGGVRFRVYVLDSCSCSCSSRLVWLLLPEPFATNLIPILAHSVLFPLLSLRHYYVGFGIKNAQVASETHAIGPGQLDDLVFDRVSVDELNERRAQKRGRRQGTAEAAREASQTKKTRV